MSLASRSSLLSGNWKEKKEKETNFRMYGYAFPNNCTTSDEMTSVKCSLISRDHLCHNKDFQF